MRLPRSRILTLAIASPLILSLWGGVVSGQVCENDCDDTVALGDDTGWSVWVQCGGGCCREVDPIVTVQYADACGDCGGPVVMERGCTSVNQIMLTLPAPPEDAKYIRVVIHCPEGGQHIDWVEIGHGTESGECGRVFPPHRVNRWRRCWNLTAQFVASFFAPSRLGGNETTSNDTTWVGYSPGSADPNKVGVGGRWDWDMGLSGTDSTQFWTFYRAPQDLEDNPFYPTPSSREPWYFDYGNNINIGNTALWASREAAGRAYRRTGVTGAWHRDPMTGIPGSAGPISGAYSAWCGLREVGDGSVRDELTNNALSGDLAMRWHMTTISSGAWPGYGDQWDQILYHDVPTTGGPLVSSFRLRTNLSRVLGDEDDRNGAGWFNPDPTSIANFVINPADSFMVWVGIPKEAGIPDTNHRWLSEVLDFSATGALQPQKLFAVTGKVPAFGTDTTIVLSIPDFPGSSHVRIALQVKTNRVSSDEEWGEQFNTADGAVVLDDVDINGVLSSFESGAEIRARALINGNGTLTVRDPAAAWVTTGKAPAGFGHIHNAGDLPYADPCGSPDGFGGARMCNLQGNVLVQSQKDDGEVHRRDTWNQAISPTVKLAPGNPQGIPYSTLRALVLQADIYPGFMGLDQGTFLTYGLRYMNSAQPWTSVRSLPMLVFDPDRACYTIHEDLTSLLPSSGLDSLQLSLGVVTECARFGSSLCGETFGTYVDNVRLGLVGSSAGSGIRAFPWTFAHDTFPFDESTAPGSAGFDTTTALLETGLNRASELGGEGVVLGDSLVYETYPRGAAGTRMDLVFRILPGPGNYSIKGNRSSPLWKVPSNPALGVATAGDGSFWGQFIAANGAVGSTNRHGTNTAGKPPTYWDVDTWNSARMDTAQMNYFPLVARKIGTPVLDHWTATYHEEDPKFTALGFPHDLCFLVNPTGALDHSNTCCSSAQCAGSPFFTSYPPAGYPGATQTTTKEGTKTLPDGLFTPGTHIEYFARRSTEVAPNVPLAMVFDTTQVTDQDGGAAADLERWSHCDVLPDLWKDSRFGGPGLACLLVVDATDRRGVQPSVMGSLDSLGYGKANGASDGWLARPSAGSSGPNSAQNFVASNLGQAGLAFDWYDIGGVESGQGGHLGCRFASPVDPGMADRQCKAGPTLDMLNQYGEILWFSGDLPDALQDGVSHQGESDDALLLQSFLQSGGAGNEKALWLNGNDVAQNLATAEGQGSGLLSMVGAVLVSGSYYDVSGNSQSTAIFKPLDADPGVSDPFHSIRRYGFLNACVSHSDVIDVDPNAAGAQRAARYEDNGDRGMGGSGPFISSVFRGLDPAAGRFYATLLDGFSFDALRGWGGPSDPSSIGSISSNDYGRREWMSDALTAFNLCARVNPVIGVGDVPGLALNFVHGTFPNPSVAGAASVRFSLAQAAKVTIRFYNVAGRLVHEATIDGHAGSDNLYRWDGVTSSGVRAASGVYFYRLSAPGVQFQNNGQRMVILGSDR